MLLRWMHAQCEVDIIPFSVPLHNITAGPYLQASFEGSDASDFYKSCKVPSLSSFILMPLRYSCYQLLRGNTLSHLCSLPFTFYLTTPSESLRAMICLVGEFSCSKETRKYTWALSSMTHLKAAVPAQHNSWSRIHFACAVRGFRAALL